MRFTKRTATPFESPNITGHSFNTADEFPDMSAAVMDVSGWHGLVKARAARCFHVLEGEGLFIIAGREFRVEKGDVIMVPSLLPHDIFGDMRLFVVHTPGFRRDDVKWLD